MPANDQSYSSYNRSRSNLHRPSIAARRRQLRRRRAAALFALVVIIVALIVEVGKHSSTPTNHATTTLQKSTTSLMPTTTSIPANGGIGSYAVGYVTQDITYTLNGRTRSLPTIIRYPSLGTPGFKYQSPGSTSDKLEAPYPLIVFSQGFDISAEAYIALLNTWASAGYVVADPTYPSTDPGAPGGPQRSDLVNHPSDLREVLNYVSSMNSMAGSPLNGIIDSSSIGVVGHSDGGDVSLAAVANSADIIPGIKAAAILSGAEYQPFGGSYFSNGQNTPLLVVQGTNDNINPPGCSAQIYNSAAKPKYFLGLVGASHQPPYLDSGADQTLVMTMTTLFFDTWLKGETSGVQLLNSQAQSAASISFWSNGTSIPETLNGSCPGAPNNG
ncbi:MAG: alpha/beta hydrolase [Acidimicrobiales bacterium]|nr:alpha/beta hydrolase [Acidimicrobiales bacterium]